MRCIPHRRGAPPEWTSLHNSSLKLVLLPHGQPPLGQLASPASSNRDIWASGMCNRLRTQEAAAGLVGRVHESSLAQEVAFEGLDRGLYFSMRVRKGTQDRARGTAGGGRAACLPGRSSCPGRALNRGSRSLYSTARASTSNSSAVVPRGAGFSFAAGLGSSHAAGARGFLHR